MRFVATASVLALGRRGIPSQERTVAFDAARKRAVVITTDAICVVPLK